MGTFRQSDPLERASRLIAVAGSLIGAAWGIQWVLRVHPFGLESGLQLLFSLLIVVSFAVRAAGANLERRRWVSAACLSALWVWRCSFKHYPLGVVMFSILAGLATVGFLIAWRRERATQPRVAADGAAPRR